MLHSYRDGQYELLDDSVKEAGLLYLDKGDPYFMQENDAIITQEGAFQVQEIEGRLQPLPLSLPKVDGTWVSVVYDHHHSVLVGMSDRYRLYRLDDTTTPIAIEVMDTFEQWVTDNYSGYSVVNEGDFQLSLSVVNGHAVVKVAMVEKNNPWRNPKTLMMSDLLGERKVIVYDSSTFYHTTMQDNVWNVMYVSTDTLVAEHHPTPLGLNQLYLSPHALTINDKLVDSFTLDENLYLLDIGTKATDLMRVKPGSSTFEWLMAFVYEK